MSRKDDADYLKRVAELERRIATGESIDEIMRQEQRERCEDRIREITAQRLAERDE